MRMNSGIENNIPYMIGGEVWPCYLNRGDNFDMTTDTFLAGAGEVLVVLRK